MRDEYLSLLNMMSDIQSLVIYMKEYLLREVNLLSKSQYFEKLVSTVVCEIFIELFSRKKSLYSVTDTAFDCFYATSFDSP